MRGAGLLKPFIYGPLKHLIRLAGDRSYRRFCWFNSRYGWTQRVKRKIIRLHDKDFIVPDVASFISSYYSIFVEEIYSFRAANDTPAILDCGANIGLSCIYFKQLYPRCSICAYEADPYIYDVLRENIASFGLKDIELLNCAVTGHAGSVTFRSDGADGGRVSIEGECGGRQMVRAVALRDILASHHFDFIKIDIEGAETEALNGCQGLLGSAVGVFVEFHSIAGRPQELGLLISMFEREGFRLHAHSEYTVKNPFLGIVPDGDMDMRLNFFFYRTGEAKR
jgi:FkbM family methyltransferase